MSKATVAKATSNVIPDIKRCSSHAGSPNAQVLAESSSNWLVEPALLPILCSGHRGWVGCAVKSSQVAPTSVMGGQWATAPPLQDLKQNLSAEQPVALLSAPRPAEGHLSSTSLQPRLCKQFMRPQVVDYD
jgi:hypothetical protein